jgi:hypothetical protein
MKLSEFFVGSRQLFGFIAPGAMCISAWMLVTGEEPLRFLSGKEWGLRLILFVGFSFVVGFAIQTPVFRLMETLDEHGCLRRKKARCADAIRLARAITLVKQRLEADLGIEVPPERVPRYCRNIALEYCTYARYRIIEMESEINFMVALSFSLPAVAFGWMVSSGPVWDGEWERLGLFAATLAVSGWIFLWRIPQLRSNEKVMWCEKYLILRARSHYMGTESG